MVSNYEAQKLKARAMNAERMVEKLKEERTITQGWNIAQNYIIVTLVVVVITLLIW